MHGLGLEGEAYLLAQLVDGIVTRHDALDPLVGEFGKNLFLHLLDGHRAIVGTHDTQAVRVVALAFELEALRLAHVHAQQLLVEALGHEATAHRVDAAVRADAAQTLAVEAHLDGDEEAVIRTDRMRLGGDEVRIHVHVCAYLLVDIDVDGFEWRHGDLHGIIRAEGETGLGNDVDLEGEGMSSLETGSGLDLGLGQGGDATLVEGEGDEHVHCLRLEDGVDVVYAKVLGQRIGNGPFGIGT